MIPPWVKANNTARTMHFLRILIHIYSMLGEYSSKSSIKMHQRDHDQPVGLARSDVYAAMEVNALKVNALTKRLQESQCTYETLVRPLRSRSQEHEGM